MPDSSPHSERFDVRFAREAMRYWPQSPEVSCLSEALDEIERLREQLESARLEAERSEKYAEELRSAAHRARHELDQWVYADGSATYRVERAESILAAALEASNPASEPSIDGDESCFDCGAPRKQGCGCWLNNPYHLWASRAARQTDA